MLHLEHSLVWRGHSDTWESRSEIIWKFWNVVLEKDRKDQLKRSCEKLEYYDESGGKEYSTYKKKKEG